MIGLILEIIGTIITWVAPGSLYTINPFTGVFSYTMLGLALTIPTVAIVMVGLVLIFAGTIGLKRQYQTVLPMVAGILGLVAAIMWLITNLLIVVGVALGGIMLIPSFALLGVFWILLGVSFIIIREKTGRSGLSTATGVLGIVAGALYCSILLPGLLIPQFVLLPTLICAALLFRGKEAPAVGAKKLVVRPAEARKRMKPEEIEASVYKYVKQHPGGIDLAECARELRVSEGEVEKAVKALVKKGKLEME